MFKSIWIRIVLGIIALLALLLLIFKFLFGGGQPYPGISTDPTIATSDVQTPISIPFPPGMVAASPDGRLFFTYHMLHKPERFVEATLYEWVDGQARPFPDLATQPLIYGAMGITADQQNRLWVIVPGALEGKPTRLVAIDRNNGDILIDHAFAKGVAGMAQDMRVSPDGRTVYVADTGLFKFQPASLIVFDVERETSRTVLRNHDSVAPQDWVIRKTNGEDYRLGFGLLTFTVGVDGIALNPEGDWLTYATMSHDSVYRVPTAALRDPSLNYDDIAAQIEFLGHKPMSDGIEYLLDGRLLITDVENGGIGTLSPDGVYQTLIKDPRIDWADSVTVTPTGDIWFTDSRLTALIDSLARPSDEATMRAAGPYPIHHIPAEALDTP